ncbi:solute carrier family 13 member 5-like isoform X3 [Haliotis rufescens]|uniref:solute carrier family 13 member 5-like isoform X3 n=1 Tax=Haliotis rufescens TaxID=6454 RepID=UPI00201F5658|nr:solute carrier family 13 member 5-like isoform X3 [Haliotis rufescens]
MAMSKTLKDLWRIRTLLILFLTPILLLPLPVLIPTKEGRCAYVVILMAVFWISESLPISVTALLPVFMFPLLNVVEAKVISKAYMNDTIMVFLGGLCMAVAIEHWNIHRRIALRILMLVGSEPRWLMLGLMIATWFLSMWISNTATTAMMIPIANAILLQLKDTRDLSNDQGAIEMNGKESNNEKIAEKEDPEPAVDKLQSKLSDGPGTPEEAEFTRLKKGLSLCIAYGANSGGIASLTGTGPNLVLKGQTDELYSSRGIESPVNFASWMAYGFPLSVVVLIVCWGWLNILYLRCKGFCSCLKDDPIRKLQAEKVKNVILTEYKKLGSITYAQANVMVLFLLLVIFWISRDLGGVGGWGDLFEDNLVKDSTPAVLMAVLLFVLPSKLPRVFCLRRNSYEMTEEEKAEADAPITPLLTWKVLHEKMPWALFLLLGGGYALAKGCEESGLSYWIGIQLQVLKDLNPWLLLLIICYVCAAATEVTSNTATATLVMPILSNLAIGTGVNPLFYMFPAALSVSFAYMLPAATPPNAIVFGYGHIKVSDMASAGIMMNILAVPLLLMATATWGDAIFHFGVVPEAFRLNSTLPVNITSS